MEKRLVMTYEEMQETMRFIVEQQAQITRQQQEFVNQLAEFALQSVKNKDESDARMKHIETTLT